MMRFLLPLLLLTSPAIADDCDPAPGAAIFQTECLRCHVGDRAKGPVLDARPYEVEALAARGVGDLAASHRKTDGLIDPDKVQALVCYLNAQG